VDHRHFGYITKLTEKNTARERERDTHTHTHREEREEEAEEIVIRWGMKKPKTKL
jgi:hypothetical protein